MKLSEAMRIGAMQCPATRPGSLRVIRLDQSGNPCAACAIGAAALAVGLIQEGLFGRAILCKDGALVERFPILLERVTSPVGSATQPLISIASNLFESHGWTREAVADWIEQIERQQESDAQVSVPVPVTAI